MEYLVIWKIDVDTNSPVEAAKEALRIQRDSNSSAVVFEVTDKNGNTETIDLEEHGEKGLKPAGRRPHRYPFSQ